MVDDANMVAGKGRLLIERLSSLPLSAGIMAALIAWLSIGLLLANHPATGPAVKHMNDQVILHWLWDNGESHWLLSAWLGGVLALSGLLMVNLICCGITMLLPKLLTRKDLKSFVSLLLHGLIGLVMLVHGVNLAVGFKTAYQKLSPGQSLALPDGRTLRLESVTYSAPRKLLTMDHHQGRREMTRERMDLKDNYADFSLQKSGRTIDTGRAFLLRPFRYGSMRVTINRFFLAGSALESAPLGVIVTVADNPLHETFFLLYALMIVCFLAYVIVSGKNGAACA